MSTAALRVPLYIWDDVPWSFYRELWDQEIIGFSVQIKGLEKVGTLGPGPRARQLWSSLGDQTWGNWWGITWYNQQNLGISGECPCGIDFFFYGDL